MSYYRQGPVAEQISIPAKNATVEVLPMPYLITIAGAIQLTRWVLALLDAIEKPSVPTPTKARHRGL